MEIFYMKKRLISVRETDAGYFLLVEKKFSRFMGWEGGKEGRGEENCSLSLGVARKLLGRRVGPSQTTNPRHPEEGNIRCGTDEKLPRVYLRIDISMVEVYDDTIPRATIVQKRGVCRAHPGAQIEKVGTSIIYKYRKLRIVRGGGKKKKKKGKEQNFLLIVYLLVFFFFFGIVKKLKKKSFPRRKILTFRYICKYFANLRVGINNFFSNSFMYLFNLFFISLFYFIENIGLRGYLGLYLVAEGQYGKKGRLRLRGDRERCLPIL